MNIGIRIVLTGAALFALLLIISDLTDVEQTDKGWPLWAMRALGVAAILLVIGGIIVFAWTAWTV